MQAPTAPGREQVLYVDPVPFGSASRRRSAGGASPAAADAGSGTRPTRRSSTSFDELFDENYERLVRTLTVVAGDREQAADAVQEAFVKAHLRWSRISGYDDPAGWVRRVAINRLRNVHRGASRRRRVLDRLAGRREAGAGEPEIDEFDRLLATLPRQQRATTALFYVDGLSVAEIASTLELSEGTVKSHLYDARRRLRPILEQENER